MAATPKIATAMIKAEVRDDIATLTIRRPQLLNSINPVVLHQLHLAFDRAANDAEVKGIVIAGEGKAFVVGADIRFFLRNLDAGDIPRILQFNQAGHRFLNAVNCCPKPVVARVGGAALGGGVELALACHHIVASPRASFGFPETGLGIYPAWGGTQRTSRAVGVGLAKWLVLSGKTLSAADAWKIGLIDQVVPHEELDTACRACARGRFPDEKCPTLPQPLAAIEKFFERSRADDLHNGTALTGSDPVLIRAMRPVAAKAPIALRLAERLIEEGAQQTLEVGLQMEIDHVAEVFKTRDAYLGLTHVAQSRIGGPAFVGQ